MQQNEIDRANAEFWDELCGTTMAKTHGIQDRSLNSLRKFDELYFEYYPYLLRHVPVNEMHGKNVLEIGLGYGSLGLKIVQAGAKYTGLDIAEGPVKMMKHRLNLLQLNGKAIQENFLTNSLPDESMDMVVSIGCFHHTGDLQRCFDEVYRILKHNGRAMLMIYNQRSYQQWIKWPKETVLSLIRDYNLLKKITPKVSKEQRAAYDNNSLGQCAPETIFTSISQVRSMMSQYSKVICKKENWNDLPHPFYRILPRPILLKTVGKILGLDIYISARK